MLRNTIILTVSLFVLCSCANESTFSHQPEVAINDSLQQIVAEAMEKPIADRNPDWACAILLNKEGQVVALFDTDSAQSHINEDLDVGSILRPFTILGALLTTSVDRTATYPVTKNGLQTGGYRVYDAHPMDTMLTVQDIIAVSSNIGEYEILSQAYNDPNTLAQFNEYMRTICIDAHADTLPELLHQVSHEELTTSPLHLAWLYHCLAQNLLPEAWQEAATLVREGMHEAVWNNIGTASALLWNSGAQSDEVQIIGKTGSARINNDPRHHTISFCGIFPEENPEYTCLVMISNPLYPYSARMDCAAPVRGIAERIIK